MSNNKLNNLTQDDVWIFTKQSVSFDTAFRAVKLFSEIPDRENVNIEDYFTKNHERYGIGTDRHRVLVIPQMYGLLTKRSLYSRGTEYKKENPTEMFELLNACEFSGAEYNKLKSEQLLKLKIRAIIDVAGNNDGWCILPVVFSYKVLKTLKEQHKINSVHLDLFYTYVMTCQNYSEVGEAVEYIRTNAPACEHVAKYKDRSRFITLVTENINLFTVANNQISINENFDEYFNEQFMERFDIDELNFQLSRDVDYTYFLTTHQNFNVNLIDEDAHRSESRPPIGTPKVRKKKVIEVKSGVLEDDDSDYVEKVDDVKEYNINIEIAKDAFRNKPSAATSGVLKRYSKNPLIGKVAIKKAGHQCENNSEHKTFISSRTKQQFMEAHHLIPINLQDDMWDKFGANIDCTENIISLCPNCHRAIHYAIKDVKKDLAIKLFTIKQDELGQIGIVLSLEDMMRIYGIR